MADSWYKGLIKTLLEKAAPAFVNLITETLLNEEMVKKYGDKFFDLLEDMVEDSNNKIDDAIVLPLIRAMRSALSIPDRPNK